MINIKPWDSEELGKEGFTVKFHLYFEVTYAALAG